MAVWEKDIEDSDHLIWRRLFPLLQGQGNRAIAEHELREALWGQPHHGGALRRLDALQLRAIEAQRTRVFPNHEGDSS